MAHIEAHAHEDHFHKSFHGAREWSKVFDDPKRDQWQKPARVIDALGLAEDSVVADIGAGTGYFAIPLAKRYPGAKIIAVDVEPDMVAYLKKRARKEKLKNVRAIKVPADAPITLPEKVDLALVVDTYHHIAERTKYFSRLGEFIKPDGQLVIIDFTLDSPEGPPAKHRIQPDRIREELEPLGYVQDKTYDFLPYQFFLVFKRSIAQ